MITPGELARWSIAFAVAASCAAYVGALVVATLGEKRALAKLARRRSEHHRICGVIEGGSQRPCVLADGHQAVGDREHATTWVDDDDPKREVRHRWDANDVLGREERRYKPEFLPKFTNDGERAGK